MSPFNRRALRKSQAVMTFGPGAIVDLRDESVMMAGIDRWPDSAVEIHEPNLESLLRVRGFRMPPVADSPWQRKGSGDLPAVLFPRYMVCPQCNRLADYETFTGIIRGRGPLKCASCRKRIYPARLIVACRRGHVDDFPWNWWVHRGEPCARPALTLKSRGRTASLGDLVVRCKTCDKWRTLAGATFPGNLKGLSCAGKRPWLLDREDCSEELIPLQRGASNVYFPILVSSISIPPWSSAIQNRLDSYWRVLSAVPEPHLKKTVEDMRLPEEVGMSAEEIVQAIIERKAGESSRDTDVTEEEVRYQESLALRKGSEGEHPLDEFRASETSIPQVLKGLVARVVLVQRLREVRALRGFTRVDAPDPSDRLNTELAPISRRPLSWLPAIEVRGEGIYLELDEAALKKWETARAVQGRAEKLQATYDEMCRRRGWIAKRRITPRLILVHSLAHGLIRRMSLESGYASASIRERLYVFDADQIREGSPAIAGLLLYTSTVDSEGSLGGLVRQGVADRLAPTFLGTLEEAAWCASDPLCIESEGQGLDAMNLAACHACLLISETSCEEYNRLLDRVLLIGTPTDPSVGFFSRIVAA